MKFLAFCACLGGAYAVVLPFLGPGPGANILAWVVGLAVFIPLLAWWKRSQERREWRDANNEAMLNERLRR